MAAGDENDRQRRCCYEIRVSHLLAPQIGLHHVSKPDSGAHASKMPAVHVTVVVPDRASGWTLALEQLPSSTLPPSIFLQQ